MPCTFCDKNHFLCGEAACIIRAEFAHRPAIMVRISGVFQYEWIMNNVIHHVAKHTLDQWIYYRLRDCDFLDSNPTGGAIQHLEELERQHRSIGGRNMKRKMLDEARQQLLREAKQELKDKGGRKT